MAELYDRLTTFLINLECLDAEERKDAIANEVLETGGVYVPPPNGDTWASHVFEINLHGVSAMGATEEETIRNWTKYANRQCSGRASLNAVIATDQTSGNPNHIAS